MNECKDILESFAKKFDVTKRQFVKSVRSIIVNMKIVACDDDENNREKNFKSYDKVEEVEGVLEILPDGFGFLRGSNYLSTEDDVYVAYSQIKRFGMRTGDKIKGYTRPPNKGEKFRALIQIKGINDKDPETSKHRPTFEH